jgi:Ca-activated chloride channel family protein
MITFKYPAALYLLILPALILAYNIYRDSRKKTGIGFSNITLYKHAYKKTYKTYLAALSNILRALVIVLLVIAVARPQFGEEEQNTTKLGIDIFIALDVSGSMAAEDLKPDRITAARELTGAFIKKLSDHRVGIAVFAGRSMTLSPLSTDISIMSESVSKINIGEMPIDGTAIGDAIANCVYKLKNDKKTKTAAAAGGAQKKDGGDTDGQKDKNKVKSQIIILLTDGENNSGNIEPMLAAKIAYDEKIKIYTIGIGSKEGAPIPVTQGGRKFYMRNHDGSLVIPKLDEKLLQEIAELTGGLYFRATDEKKLKEIYDIINKLEKSEIITSKFTLYSEKAHYPLFLAFILMIINFIIEYRALMKL